MRLGLLSINVTLHDTILVDTNGGQHIQRILVAGIDTVKDQADDNLLPGRTTFVPELGLFDVDNLTNVLHDTVESTGGEGLVFVIVGDGDEQLGVTVVHGGTEVVAIVQGELVGVTGGRGVYQLLILFQVFVGRDQNVHRMWVNSSLPPSRSLRYLAWMAFWMALGEG